ncbi:MAG: radical SAM protein [Candidatus Cloacimonadota bacterium]|nr:MAG: radical SAM protein [Candidatus Cloacimonadota bacterium]
MFYSLKSRLNYSLGKLVPTRFIIGGLKLHPATLLVELTNICNANCIYCGYRFMKRDKGIMKQKLFEKLIDEFDDKSGGDINLTGVVGDPLIDRNIVEKIKYSMAKKNIRNIKFSTNGILLQRIGVKKLLESGVNSILINIGGMDKETYKRLFGVDDFYKVYENVRKILLTNKSMHGKVDLTIVIKVISLEDVLKNKSCLSLKELAKECDARIIFDNIYDSWSGRISKKDMVDDMKLKMNREKKEPCSLLYNTLSIMWNGDVVPCCRDIDGEVILGNILQQSIDEIWRGDILKNLRRSFTKGSIPAICKKCEHYEGLKPLKNLHLFKKALRDGRSKVQNFNYKQKGE